MTKEHPDSFSEQVSITLVARLFAVAGSVASGVLMARFLGAEGVGIYAVLTATVNTMVQIAGAGLASANVLFTRRESSPIDKIVANSAIYAALAGIVGALAIYAAYVQKPDWFRDLPANLLIISLATLPFQLWTLFGLNLFLAAGDVKKFNLLDWLSQSQILVNALIVLVLLGYGLRLLVLFNAVGIVLVALVIASLVRRLSMQIEPQSRFLPDKRLFAKMMRFGLNINVMNAGLALVLRADIMFVNYFRGEAEAGVYAVASQCILLLVMFPNVVGTILFPSVAGMTGESGTFTSRVIRHVAAAQVLLCVISIPAAFMLPYIYGSAFSDATVQFLILLPGAVAIGLQMMLSQHLVAVGKVALLPYYWIFALTISVGLNLVFIPAYGAIGAAVVSTTVYAVIFLLTLFYFRRHTGVRTLDTLVLRRSDASALFARFGW